MATTSNIYIDQGADFSSVIDLANDNGTDFDLTDYSAIAQIRKSYTSGAAVSFNTAIDVQAASLTISLTPEQTSGLKAGRYVYDVKIYKSTPDSAVRVVEGILVVTPSVSRQV